MTDLRSLIGKHGPSKHGPVDPIELFRALKIRAGSPVKEMWAPQADALREWHQHRGNPDVLFQLNTGAGKTLIGLVAAQSIVNESKGQVVYCCATNQLVEQTRAKAEELGIATAVYTSHGWEDRDVFDRAQGPVLTNYAALFNGKNIFAKHALRGAIFDDAHTAHDSIRSAYTISLDRQEFPEIYSAVVEGVREYFGRVGRGYQFEAVVDQRDGSTVLFVPMFESVRHAVELQRIFVKAKVEETKSLMFAWAHLGARLDRCAVLLDATHVEVTPLLPPVHSHRVFRKDVRRLYLSATLRVNDEFIRTFGRAPSPIINPGGRAGDTERLFLVASSDMIDDAARGWAEDATRGRKAVVMVPSSSTAEHWRRYGHIFASEDGHARIRRFAASKDERLVFVARYDGIDLPDDDCRMMVVDGLPSGMSLLDRFFENHLERAGISDGKIAARFVQLLGRTSRGMSDYGAVLLVGRRLLEWVLPPVHRALLPDHIQKQISVGELLSSSTVQSRQLIEKCLTQAEDWRDFYDSQMENVAAEPLPGSPDQEIASQLAWAERRAAEALWDGEPRDAVRGLAQALTDAYRAERALGAWFAHWLGYALQRSGDMTTASERYREAARVRTDLGSLPEAAVLPAAADAEAYSPQASRMSALLGQRSLARVEKELKKAASDLRDMDASAGVHEEAIRVLGEYLGYNAIRGDVETGGKAHDDLWEQPDKGRVLCFDAKTKKGASRYTKEYIGQSAQHALWAEKHYPDSLRLLYIVGPRVSATPQATPPSGIRVVTQQELARVADAVAGVYRRAADCNLPLFHPAEIENGLQSEGFTWEELPGSLETVRLDSIAPN